MFRVCAHRSTSVVSHGSRRYVSASSSETTSITTLKVRLREAADQPGVAQFADLRQSTLYKEMVAWGQRQAQAAAQKTVADCTDDNARNAAAVQAICYTLDAYLDFSRHYDAPPAPPVGSALNNERDIEQAFLTQIRPRHREHLLTQFHESIKANTDDRRAAVLSTLDCHLLDKLCAAGIVSLATIDDEVQAYRQQAQPTPSLTEAELLAVVDYLNSATGTFNVVNGAAIASAYYGEHALRSRISVFSAALNSAISKLCNHPYFARRDIVCYKGIRLSRMDSPFRLAALNDACARQSLIAFPNVLSASCDPEQSYARKKYEQGYTLECRLTMRRGFYADPFHDPRTMGEQEILGPANQRFRVTGKSGFNIIDWSGETPQEVEVDRYEMKPADL